MRPRAAESPASMRSPARPRRLPRAESARRRRGSGRSRRRERRRSRSRRVCPGRRLAVVTVVVLWWRGSCIDRTSRLSPHRRIAGSSPRCSQRAPHRAVRLATPQKAGSRHCAEGSVVGGFSRNGSHSSPDPAPPLAPPPLPPARARLVAAPHLLVANGNASGLSRRTSLLDASARSAPLGARVEPRLTATTEELAEALHHGRRVVLLGGDGLSTPPPTRRRTSSWRSPAGGANNVAHSLGVPLEMSRAAAARRRGFAAPDRPDRRPHRTSSYLALEGVSVGFHAMARANYRGANLADFSRRHQGRPRRTRPATSRSPSASRSTAPTRSSASRSSSSANLPFFGPGSA